jgi:DNA-binding transcriptional MerR regulator
MDLAELSKASGVSPRTIRYYIQEGLLPSPGKRGRGARYDRALLPRLQLIQLLQRDAWPLAKIAQHMSELDDDGVRRELGSLEGGERREERGARKRMAPTTPLLPPLSSLPPQRSTWERVRVDPTLEINVRTTLSGKRRKRVDRLIESARQIFEES